MICKLLIFCVAYQKETVMAIRYDRAPIRAQKTDEGYLVDTPVVGRIGIQEYTAHDGTVRRELRLPEDVYAEDSLSSFAGKPITDDHPEGTVTAANAKRLMIGTITGPGMQGDGVVTAPVTIYDGEAIAKIEQGGKRELSLGYVVDLDETPGVWEGCPYDAIQRNIRINHLALVKSGRAGVARLNMDGNEILERDNHNNQTKTEMEKLKLDNGIEYEAAPEVVVAFEAIRADLETARTDKAEAQGKIDALTAEVDTLKAEVAKIEQIKADAIAEAKAEIAERAALEVKAEKFAVKCDGLEARAIKEACIKASRKDADLEGKSDEYIDAAFDLAVELVKDADDKMAGQRKEAGKKDGADDKLSAREMYLKNLGKKETV